MENFSILENIYTAIMICRSHLIDIQCSGQMELIPKIDDSYIIENGTGLLHIKGKFNHFIILKCRQLTVILDEAPISGMDILHSQDIRVTGMNQGYLNMELSCGICIHNYGKYNFLCRIGHCMTVTIQEKIINVNPWIVHIDIIDSSDN